MKPSLTSLSEDSQHVYQDFFGRHELVWSTNHLIHLLPIVARGPDVPLLLHRTYTQLYVGIRRIPESVVRLTHIYHLVGEQYEIYHGLDHRLVGQVHTLLQQYLDEHHARGGCEVSMLSQQSFDTGFGGISYVATGLAIATQMMTGQISMDGEIVTTQETIQLAMSLKSIFKQKPSIRGSFIHSICGRHKGSWIAHQDGLQELGNEELPFDMTVIHTGARYEMYNIAHAVSCDRPAIGQILSGVHEQITDTFGQLAQRPHDAVCREHYRSLLEQYSHLIQYVQGTNHLIAHVITLLDQYKIFAGESFAVLPFESCYEGGSMQIISKKHSSRQTLSAVIEALTHHIPKVDVLWENRRHPYRAEPKGIIREQNISQGLVSDYVDLDTCCMRMMDGSLTTGSYDTLMSQSFDMLVIDIKTSMLIYHGQEFTHPLIKSVSFTIQCMQVLMMHLNETVRNTQLPHSGYSKAKNQLVGKIIGPLQRVVHELFDDELLLECKGGLYEYQILLKKSSLPIGLLTSLYQS